jgi:PAS domain S-box-containing protein
MSKDIYKELFHISDNAMAIIDTNGKLLDYNNAYKELFGYEKVMSLTTFHPGEISPQNQPNGENSLDESKKMIDLAFKNGENSFNWTHQNIKNNLTFLSKVNLKKIEYFEKEALFVVISDIEEGYKLKKIIETKTKDLKEKTKLLLSVINNNPNPIVVKNYEGKFILVNDALAKLYNSSKKEMIGKDDGDYIPDKEMAEFFKQNVREIMDKGNTEIVYEDSIDVNTGKVHNYMSIKKPFVDEFDEKFILVIANDITKLNELQKEQEQQARILNHQSKMAELGALIGAIIHQWKQPLNLLSLYTQNLELKVDMDMYDQKTLFEFIEKVQDQLKFMTNTATDFKDFLSPSKLQSNFEIVKSINKIKKILNYRFVKADVEFELISNNNCILNGYPNEFEHVILNLMNNSIDEFIKQKKENKKITIEVSCTEEYSLIIFKDNAGGIKESLLPSKLFEEYISTKEDSDGTGIGLNLAKKIIENNFNGSIKASNSEDGAIFKIII